jgi:hypothetical protein
MVRVEVLSVGASSMTSVKRSTIHSIAIVRYPQGSRCRLFEVARECGPPTLLDCR